MKPQFSLYRRNGIYYSQDTHNGKQESLRTRDEAAAKALLHSKNEAFRQAPSRRSHRLACIAFRLHSLHRRFGPKRKASEPLWLGRLRAF